MQKLADIRRRIRSVTSIGTVCATLATVSAARLSQTRARALEVSQYAAALRSVLQRQQASALATGEEPASLSPLFAERPHASATLLVAGVDRGLCGGYAISVHQCAVDEIRRLQAEGVEVRAVIIGERTGRVLARRTDVEIESIVPWPTGGVSSELVDALAESLTTAFTTAGTDIVLSCGAAFFSTVSREPRITQLLPIAAPDEGTIAEKWDYEPARADAIGEVIRAFARLQVEDALLEAYAAEQAARMVTMQEASERASKSLADMRIAYNRVRRESLTSDMIGVLVARRVAGEESDAGAA